MDLSAGTVLKLFVTDTNPPKTKRFIIVGFDDDKVRLAYVYINTGINRNFAWSIELECLHLKLEARGRAYLDHDSWVDCSDIIIKETSEILDLVNKRTEAITGHLNNEDFRDIITLLRSSPKIKGKIKKRFGLYEI